MSTKPQGQNSESSRNGHEQLEQDANANANLGNAVDANERTGHNEHSEQRGSSDEHDEHDEHLARGQIFDQAVRLPRLAVTVVFVTIGLLQLVATLDTTLVSTSLPHIAAEFNSGATVTWVGTSMLVAQATTLSPASRLSDIFGRKQCLIASLLVFALGNLLCGFAQSPAWLYVARGIAGAGAGAINSLSLIVVSDVVSLRDRGKYMSYMGIPVALGLGLGPELGGVLADHASWRWAFWITVPLTLVNIPVIWWYLPLKPVPGSMWGKLASVDWFGCGLSLAGIVLVLVPLSAGGATIPWDSAAAIAMLVVGGIVLITFLFAEHLHPLPVLPLRMFRNRTVALVMATMAHVGIVWFGAFFMDPLYLQNVQGYSAVVAGALVLPLLVGQIIFMVAVGYAMRRWGRTKRIIIAGYAIWTLGQGMQVAWGVERNVPLVVASTFVQGIGFGLTSQTTLVLAQASCAPADRAVVTGARNLFRTAGGAVGLAVSNAIVNAVFTSNLPADLPPELADSLRKNGFSRTAATGALQDKITHAYYLGLRDAFIMYVPAVGICLLLCLFCADTKLDEPPRERESSRDRELEAVAETSKSPTPDADLPRVRDDGGNKHAVSEDGPRPVIVQRQSRRWGSEDEVDTI